MCGGVDPHSLTLWDWQALTWNWNERHAPPEERGKALPDKDLVRASLDAKKRAMLKPKDGGPTEV